MKRKLFDNIKKEQALLVLFVIVIFGGIVRIRTFRHEDTVATFSAPVNKRVIQIDPGHGGWDPGKVADNGVLEKDINLQIADKLQNFLEQGGAYVITSRAEDEALGDSKREDMDNRKNMASDLKAEIIVSIHQNSYPRQEIKGAQVFYYKDAEQSKILAESIQARFISSLDNENTRQAKPNSDYYMLKRTPTPAVIVECGFLSNKTENENLTSDDYQEKVAWAIYMGIVDYFDNINKAD